MKSHLSKLSALTDTQWVIGIVMLGTVMRLAAILLYPHVPESDELAYLSMARSLLDGTGLVDGAGNHAFYNMGYSFFALAPIMVVFHDSILAVRLGNTVLGAIGIFMVYGVAKEAGANRAARLLGALLWALYLPAGVYGLYVAKENFMIPLMLGVVWCALRMRRAFPLGVAVLCGLFFGILALTGNAALVLAAVVGLALLLSSASKRVRLLSLPVMLATAMLVVTPWLVRNVEVLGAPILNTNGGFNLYLGNNPNATGMFVSIADTPRGPTWHALRKEAGEVNAAETLKKEAITWMAAHPLEFTALAVKKLGLFWMPPVHDGRDGSEGIEKLIRLAWLAEYLVLVGAALVSLRYLRTRPSLLILWAAVAVYSAVHMLFYVIFRYREPITPVVCVLAGIALEPMLTWLRRFVMAPEAATMPD